VDLEVADVGLEEVIAGDLDELGGRVLEQADRADAPPRGVLGSSIRRNVGSGPIAKPMLLPPARCVAS